MTEKLSATEEFAKSGLSGDPVRMIHVSFLLKPLAVSLFYLTIYFTCLAES